MLDITNSRQGILPPTVGKPCLEFVARDEKIPMDIPENEGISSRHIADFLTELNADKTLNLHNVVIARHGKIITEASLPSEQLLRRFLKTSFAALHV